MTTTPNTQGASWEEGLRDTLEWHGVGPTATRELVAAVRELLSKERAEGQQNPKVGFLRQYLNERPVLSDGRLWTDEDILRFLRVPFATLPADSTERKKATDETCYLDYVDGELCCTKNHEADQACLMEGRNY